MDVEQLITEVSLTPSIWDASHTKHSDRTFIARQWRRIGYRLGVSDDSAKKKFKNLRDQFRLELKKVPEGKAGDPSLPLEEYLSSWPWFRMMFFLKDKIHRRATTGGLTSTSGSLTASTTIKRNYDDLECTQTDACDEENMAAPHDTLDAAHHERLGVQGKEQTHKMNCCKKMKESTLQGDFLALEKQRLELLQRQYEEASDSDRMFLLSLLSSLKGLEPQRAQLFRLKVQQLLYDAHYSHTFGQ